MLRTRALTAAGAGLAGAGVLAGLAIGSGQHATTAPRTPPLEVRTEVIRKTVHVYRREHPRRGGGGAGSGTGGNGHVLAAVGAPTRAVTPVSTASSGARRHEAAIPTRPLRTRVSGTHPSTGTRNPSGAPQRRPVSTHSSGASRPSGSLRRPVRTRTSGHGGDGGEHDD